MVLSLFTVLQNNHSLLAPRCKRKPSHTNEWRGNRRFSKPCWFCRLDNVVVFEDGLPSFTEKRFGKTIFDATPISRPLALLLPRSLVRSCFTENRFGKTIFDVTPISRRCGRGCGIQNSCSLDHSRRYFLFRTFLSRSALLLIRNSCLYDELLCFTKFSWRASENKK